MAKYRAGAFFLFAIAFVLLGAIAIPYLLPRRMELPGTRVESPLCPVEPSECRLLIDSTSFDPEKGERVIKQEIFDEILEMIEKAETFVVADFFLLNPWKGSVDESHRDLSSELAAALIAKKRTDPKVEIILLTDPINRIYGEDQPDFYGAMVAAGIPIVFTDIDRLPHSNRLYSPLAATYGRHLAALPLLKPLFRKRMVPNVFDTAGEDISMLQFMRLLHFKANHRKLIISDRADGGLRLLATSFNPADGSSAHSNIGIVAGGPVAAHALRSELDCIEWSAENPRRLLAPSEAVLSRAVKHCREFEPGAVSGNAEPGSVRAQWLTEGAIRDRLLAMLNQAGRGDRIDIAIFYFSDRGLVDAVVAAAGRGVRFRIVMDANKDAFGREKNGVPNRTVAAELRRRAGADDRLSIRWALTHGEQFHSKAIAVYNPRTGKSQFLCGSANWTRRNLQDLNLEACFYIENSSDFMRDYLSFFDRIWDNRGETIATVPYEIFSESGLRLAAMSFLYRLQENTGASTF